MTTKTKSKKPKPARLRIWTGIDLWRIALKARVAFDGVGFDDRFAYGDLSVSQQAGWSGLAAHLNEASIESHTLYLEARRIAAATSRFST